MRHASFAGITLFALLSAFPGVRPSYAATINVPGQVATIQAAIDGASAGDEVVVAAGTYHERIRFWGKAITVRSTDPTDETVIAATVLDGDGLGTTVSFLDAEAPTSVLRGLTITNGNGNGGYGGGVACDNSSPTVSACAITGNTAATGGGGVCLTGGSPVLTGNWITANTASEVGGGIWAADSTPLITGNEIAGNHSNDGAGVYLERSAATLTGNILYNNNSHGTGGGILCKDSTPTIRGNTLTRNTSALGGGLAFAGTGPAVVTNTIVVFSSDGGGIACVVGATAPTVTYCCVYGNTDGEYVAMADPTGSEGNLSVDPLLAGDQDGDYHLLSYYGRWQPFTGTWEIDAQHSPCIDAGDPASPYALEPYPNGGRANMGAYGNTAQASKSLNHDPLVPTTVAISPAVPRTADNLVAEAGGATDPDGDEIIYQYQWSHRTKGEEWSPWAAGESVLPAAATTKGEQWRARARAVDVPDSGIAQKRRSGESLKNASAWVVSAPVTIRDTAPTAPPIVQVRQPGSCAGATLQAYAAGAVDDDEDPVGYLFSWSCSTDGGQTWDAWGHEGRVLSEAIEKGQLWKCRSRARAEGLCSAWVESEALTVGDTAPTAPTALAVTPDAPSDRHDLRALASGSSDVDGDTIRYVYQWCKSLDAGQTWSNWEHTCRVLPSELTTPGEQWKVRCRAISGTPTLRSDWLESSVIAIAGPALAPPVAVTATAAAGGQGTAQITVSLSAAAAVQVRVVNVAGREVVVFPGRSLPAGTQTLLWNGRSTAGTVAPAGQYLVFVEALQQGGAQTRTVVALTR